MREQNEPQTDWSTWRWMGLRIETLIVIGALLAWGLYLAIGALFAHGDKHRFARPLIIFGCVAAFVGFWLLMLHLRRRRLEREPEDGDAPTRL